MAYIKVLMSLRKKGNLKWSWSYGGKISEKIFSSVVWIVDK